MTVVDPKGEAPTKREATRTMKKGTRGEARLRVNAPPDELYEMVSDVRRMGEWSPETVQCKWIGGSTGPTPGARFKGTNKRGVFRWSTKPEVVVAERGREFSFVTKGRGPSTKWTYHFEPAPDGGTFLVESFEMLDDMSAILLLLDRYLMRISDRKADLETGMLRVSRTREHLEAAWSGHDPHVEPEVGVEASTGLSALTSAYAK